jgi:hypothetical protein
MVFRDRRLHFVGQAWPDGYFIEHCSKAERPFVVVRRCLTYRRAIGLAIAAAGQEEFLFLVARHPASRR